MADNFEIKPPMAVKEGDFCYINDQVCQVNKVRSACGEYFMEGCPILGEKSDLNHIIDCTETVKIPIVKRLQVVKSSETEVVVEEDGEERSVHLPEGPVADNIKALTEADKKIYIDVLIVDGREVVVGCHDEE